MLNTKLYNIKSLIRFILKTININHFKYISGRKMKCLILIINSKDKVEEKINMYLIMMILSMLVKKYCYKIKIVLRFLRFLRFLRYHMKY